MNHSSYVENETLDMEDESDSNGEDELGESRSKIRGLNSACNIVFQSISKWVRSPDAPPLSENGFWIELGYRKVEKPIKRFMLEWPEGDIREISEEIVEAAAMDLASATVASESYVVRLYGGNDSRTFGLSFDRDEEPEVSTAIAPRQKQGLATRHSDDETPRHPAIDAYALQLDHNVELMRQNREFMRENRELMSLMLSSRSEESEASARLLKDQRLIINKMVKQRFETIEATEEIMTRKHDLDAEARESERKAQRDAKLEEMVVKFVLPTLAAKLGMTGLVQGLVNAPPQDPMAQSLSNMSAAEAAIHEFLGSIRPEQLSGIMADGTIKFDDNQKGSLIEMMTILQAQYEAAQGADNKGPNHG